MNSPELYVRNNKFQRHIVAQVVQENLKNFQWRSDQMDTIIDIGSGAGDMLMEIIYPILGKKFQRIVCSDLNPKMVEYASHRFYHVENSEFIEFDIDTDMELPSKFKEQFDHVVSFYCLHMIENQMKAFNNIYQLLRCDIGGDCLLNLFARGPYYDAYLVLSKTLKWSKYMQTIQKYTCYWHYAQNPEREARYMLEKCGFTNINVKLENKYYDFDNVQAFKDVMLAVSHYVHNMPEELHQEFMDDFVEAITKIDKNCRVLRDNGGKFRFYFEQLVIFARKPKAKCV